MYFDSQYLKIVRQRLITYKMNTPLHFSRQHLSCNVNANTPNLFLKSSVPSGCLSLKALAENQNWPLSDELIKYRITRVDSLSEHATNGNRHVFMKLCPCNFNFPRPFYKDKLTTIYSYKVENINNKRQK